jgi:hypothetical protein
MNDNVRQLIQFCFCKQHSMIIGHFMLLVFCIGSSHLLLTCSLWVAYVRWQQRGNIHRFIGRNLIAHFNWSNYNVSFATIEIIHTWSLSMKCLWLNLLYQFEPLYFKQQPWLTYIWCSVKPMQCTGRRLVHLNFRPNSLPLSYAKCNAIVTRHVVPFNSTF